MSRQQKSVNGQHILTREQPFIITDRNSNTQAPSLNEYTNSTHYYPRQNNTNVNNQVPLPPISRQKARHQVEYNTTSNFKLSRSFLIVPLIAFVSVAIFAALCGVIFGILYQPDYNNSGLVKTNNSFALNQGQSTSKNGLIQTTNIVSTKLTNNLPKVCGIQPVKPNLSQLRIIRGNEAIAHSWPWTVSIGFTGPRTTILHACGGSLINKRTIVTATHCVEASSVYALVGSPVANSENYKSVQSMIRIYIGVSKRSTDVNAKTTFQASRILSYPGFDQNSFKNDISIITLDRDVEESNEIGFICLEKVTRTSPGTKVYAVGWGFTSNNWFRASDTLMQVSFPIKSKTTCGLGYIPVYQFCAGDHDKGKDTCNGDSGGPLMTYVNNRFVLTGIVSNGDSACSGKGIYTNVAIYYDWIISNS